MEHRILVVTPLPCKPELAWLDFFYIEQSKVKKVQTILKHLKTNPILWKKNYTNSRHMKLRDIQLFINFLEPFQASKLWGGTNCLTFNFFVYF